MHASVQLRREIVTRATCTGSFASTAFKWKQRRLNRISLTVCGSTKVQVILPHNAQPSMISCANKRRIETRSPPLLYYVRQTSRVVTYIRDSRVESVGDCRRRAIEHVYWADNFPVVYHWIILIGWRRRKLGNPTVHDSYFYSKVIESLESKVTVKSKLCTFNQFIINHILINYQLIKLSNQ